MSFFLEFSSNEPGYYTILCWANIGDWLAPLVNSWRWQHNKKPTLAQQNSANSYFDTIGPLLAQQNSANSYFDTIGPLLAQRLSTNCHFGVIGPMLAQHFLTNCYF